MDTLSRQLEAMTTKNAFQPKSYAGFWMLMKYQEAIHQLTVQAQMEIQVQHVIS